MLLIYFIFKSRIFFKILYIIFFERVRNESDYNLNLKFLKNKNEKNSFLNFEISRFIKFNRDNNVKLLYIYKNSKNKRKSELETKYKNLIYYYCDKKDYIKFYCLNKDKSIICVDVIIIKNDLISQSS